MQEHANTNEMINVSELVKTEVYIKKRTDGRKEIVVRLYQDGINGIGITMPPDLAECFIMQIEGLDDV